MCSTACLACSVFVHSRSGAVDELVRFACSSPHSCAVEFVQRVARMLTIVLRIRLPLNWFCVQLVCLCSLPTLMCCFEILATSMFTLCTVECVLRIACMRTLAPQL